MTQPIPAFDSWWELNNRSLPVHDPYELARAVAERFSGQQPQQDAGEARLAELQEHMDALMSLADTGLAYKAERDQLRAEVASIRAALASQQADAGRLNELKAALRVQVRGRHIEQHTTLGYGSDFEACPNVECRECARLLRPAPPAPASEQEITAQAEQGGAV